MKLHIVTLTNEHTEYNSHEYKHLNMLKKTFEPQILHIINNYNSEIKNLSKIFNTFEYIKSCKGITENDVVCIIDGHDVVFNSKVHSIDNIIEQFVQNGSDIIFSTENNCAHHSHKTKLFFEAFQTNKSFRYLNSGVIIAYKKKYIEMFSDIIHNFDELSTPGSYSDQRIIGNYLTGSSTNLNISFDFNDIFTLTLNTSTEIPKQINAFFIHVTFIAKQSQYDKYKTIVEMCVDNI